MIASVVLSMVTLVMISVSWIIIVVLFGTMFVLMTLWNSNGIVMISMVLMMMSMRNVVTDV